MYQYKYLLKNSSRRKFDRLKIREIMPSSSKNIIDQIDSIFAEYFDFAAEEAEFIRKFDIELEWKGDVALSFFNALMLKATTLKSPQKRRHFFILHTKGLALSYSGKLRIRF